MKLAQVPATAGRAQTERRGMVASGVAASLVLLLALLTLRGIQTASHAQDASLSGTLIHRIDGSLAIDYGNGDDLVVGGMDFTPFVDRVVNLAGVTSDEIFFVSRMTLGTINVDDVGGTPRITLTGVVETSGEGYQMTTEGITFALVGDTETLGSLVGETVEVQGNLTGTWIAVTKVG
jgi:hypothetical protein